MIENLDEERMNYICNKTLENRSVQMSNSKIWTHFLDNQLRDFVIEYNFNYYEIANRFHEFIAYPFKYDFSEEEIRRHWAFLHSCRFLGKEIDDDYYDALKANSKIFAQEEEDLAIQEKIDFEKDQKEQEKIRVERFSMIDISGKEKIKDEVKLEDTVIDKTLKNDEQFEKCIDEIKTDKLNYLKEELEEEVTTNLASDKNANAPINNNANIDKKPEEEKDGNENDKEKENTTSGLNFDDDDEIINALFNGANNIKFDYGDLTIPGKEYNLPEVDKTDWDSFPIDTKILPTKEMTEEELIKKREEMIKEFNDEDLYKEIDSTKTFNDLLNEDKELKKTNDNLNAYFNFTRKSMRVLIPKLEKSMSNAEKDKGKFFLFLLLIKKINPLKTMKKITLKIVQKKKKILT